MKTQFKTKIKAERFGFGIPDDLIEKKGTRVIPIGNVPFLTTKRKYRRRHFQTCPECGEKKKNIRMHYQKYHKKFWYCTFIKPLKKAQIGQLYGVRFVTTSNAPLI